MMEKLEKIVFSPPFRRFVYLGLCFVLIAAGVILAMENFMSVRNEEDWIKPRSSSVLSYASAHGGGDKGHRASRIVVVIVDARRRLRCRRGGRHRRWRRLDVR